jgi:hypothetical protein
MREISTHLAAVTGSAASGYAAWAERQFGKPERIGPGPNFQTPLFRKTWASYLKARDSK